MYRIFHYVKYTTCHYISLHYITNILMIYTRSKGKPAGRCLQYSFPHPGHIKAPNFGRSTACWRSRYFESCQVASIRCCQWRPQLPETLYTVGYHGSGEMHVWKIMEVCCIRLYSHLDENKNLKQCQKNKTHFEQWNHCKYFDKDSATLVTIVTANSPKSSHIYDPVYHSYTGHWWSLERPSGYAWGPCMVGQCGRPCDLINPQKVIGNELSQAWCMIYIDIWYTLNGP